MVREWIAPTIFLLYRISEKFPQISYFFFPYFGTKYAAERL